MTRFRRATVRVLIGVVVASSLLVATAPVATAAPVFTPLTLQNGWTGAPFSTAAPAVTIVSGIVRFKGGMKTNGANLTAFTLPLAFRPLANAFVVVNLCGGKSGHLIIRPNGVTSVDAQNLADAKCFTSLDGAQFAKSADGFTQLTLQNGWQHGGSLSANAAVKLIGGVVHLMGGLNSGSDPHLFTLPVAFRPLKNVYVPVTFCDAVTGRLEISPSGATNVRLLVGFGTAQCHTSLDGVSFAKNATGFTFLTLKNGWTNAPFGTANAAAKTIDGIVHLKGAIATTGNSTLPFTLPVAFRPTKNVFVPVDLCNGNTGRLYIPPSGNVQVVAVNFGHAKCFTSLDGATFAP